MGKRKYERAQANRQTPDSDHAGTVVPGKKVGDKNPAQAEGDVVSDAYQAGFRRLQAEPLFDRRYTHVHEPVDKHSCLDVHGENKLV